MADTKLTRKQQIEAIVDKWISDYGYVPTMEELIQAYTSGEMVLNDIQEDALAQLLGE